MTIVSIHMPENTGLTGFTLYLRKTSDGTLLNTGGDALTESPASSGRFIATVAESWAETLHATVLDGSGLAVRDGWLASGSTVVDGVGSGDASQATLISVQQIVSNIASSITGAVNISGRVSSGGRLTVYQGEEWSEARQTAQSIAVVDPTGAIYAKLSSIGAGNLRFGASRLSEPASVISGTVHSVYQATVDSQLRCMIKIEIANAGAGAKIADDYKYQVKQVVSSSDFIEIEGDLSLRRMRV